MYNAEQLQQFYSQSSKMLWSCLRLQSQAANRFSEISANPADILLLIDYFCIHIFVAIFDLLNRAE